MYINDIIANIHSKLRLFADDILMYRPICLESDQEILQDDLTALMKWAETWQVDFNISKCSILQVTAHYQNIYIPDERNSFEIGGEGQVPWSIPKK